MIDPIVLHVLTKAKAYAALVGSLLTVLVAVLPPEQVPSWVLVGLAFLTAFATWAIPNAPAPTAGTGEHAALEG